MAEPAAPARPRPADPGAPVGAWALRYGGLAGALLVTIASWLTGALPTAPPTVTDPAFWSTPAGPLGLLAWLAGIGLLSWAWWRGREGAVELRWIYRTLACWTVPLLFAAPVGSRDLYSYACQGEIVAEGHDPYTMTPADLPCTWLDTVAPLWRDTPAPYGPLFLLLAAAATVGGALWSPLLLLRLTAVAGLVLAGWALPRLAASVDARAGRTGGVAGARAVWLALGCPLVLVHLVGGGHNDALMVGLLVAGLAVAATATRPAGLVAAGALLGAAAAVKATALAAVPFAALAALRPGPGVPDQPGAGRRVADAALLLGAAGGSLWALGRVSGLGDGWIGALRHTGATTQWSSPPTAVGMTVDYLGQAFGLDLDAVPVTRALGLLVLVGVGGALAWRVWRGRLAALPAAGAALAAAVLCAPVFYPWYAAWPLVVLAAAGGPAARRCALAAAAVTVLALPDGTGVPALTKPFALAVTAALVVAGVGWLRSRRLQA